MRCAAARKWISDDLDGRLSQRRTEALERHLHGCEACRSYRRDLAVIQARTRARPVPSLSPEDWSRFELDLEREIRRAPQVVQEEAPRIGQRMRWAWAGAALALLACAAVIFVTMRGQDGLDPAYLTYEASLEQIFRETRDDPGLADSFDQLILASIGDAVRGGQSDLPLDLLANPDFMEGWSGETGSRVQDENGPGAL